MIVLKRGLLLQAWDGVIYFKPYSFFDVSGTHETYETYWST
jgi:hypothetical protein